MRRRAVVALLGTVGVGLVALALVAARDDRELAFTIGVVPSTIATQLTPGATVCQTPIAVPQEFSRVRLRAGTPGGLGQPLVVSVRSADTRRALGRGRVPDGYPNPTEQATTVGQVAAGQRIAVCVRNLGRRKAALYGNGAAASPPSQALVSGRPLDTDLTLVFLASERRSMLSLVPEVFQRANLFRPAWVGTWTFWVLGVAVLLGVPTLLARSLAAASDEPRGESSGTEPVTGARRDS